MFSVSGLTPARDMTWIGAGAWLLQKFWDAYGAVDALPDACPLGFLTMFISALAAGQNPGVLLGNPLPVHTCALNHLKPLQYGNSCSDQNDWHWLALTAVLAHLFIAFSYDG